MRVECMHIEHGYTGIARLLLPFFVVQCMYLHPAAAIAFDAMAGAADDEQPVGIRRSGTRHIHGQGFVFGAIFRVVVRFDLQARQHGGLQKLDARLRVAG